MAKHTFQPDYEICPGETLKEVLEDRGISQASLAERTGLATKTINQIVRGVAPITPETAQMLEMVLGTPATFWNRRELMYRESLLQRKTQQQMAAQASWLKKLPIAFLQKEGYISKTKDQSVLVQESLKFFECSRVTQWVLVWGHLVETARFRGGQAMEKYPGYVATWLQIGKIEAAKIQTEPYDAKRFRQELVGLRSLSMTGPAGWCEAITSACAPAGVAVVFVREIPKASISGVAKWLSKDKAMIQISLKYKTDDQFWFSFFHEAGHVLLHGKKQEFLEDDGKKESELEDQANRFAADLLIPRQRVAELRGLKTKEAIRRFAAEIGVAPGIVVGRMQKERMIEYSSHNDLKRKLEWVE